MKAAVVERFGATPRYLDFAAPTAEKGEQLVRVTAAGLHPVVKAMAAGTHYTATGGGSAFVAGIDGVGQLADGTRVYFGTWRKPYGTFAEIAPAPEWITLKVPDGLPDEAAAALANPGMSSWAALKYRAEFQAVQIAQRLGARRVVAAGRNASGLAAAAENGADATISLEQERDALVEAFRKEIAENGVDVVLDYVWGAPAEAFFGAILKKGAELAAKRTRYIQIGESAGKTIALPASALRSSGVEILGSGFGSVALTDITKVIGDFFAEAAKQPFVMKTEVVPLRDVEAAWTRKEEATRIVLRP